MRYTNKLVYIFLQFDFQDKEIKKEVKQEIDRVVKLAKFEAWDTSSYYKFEYELIDTLLSIDKKNE